MSKTCFKCARKTQVKISRSHSNIATKKRQYVNLQTKRVEGKRVKICSKCLKAMSKVR